MMRWQFHILPIVIIFLLIAGCSGKKALNAPGDSTSPPPAKIANELTLPAGYIVLDQQTGDVTGDGKPDGFFLVGRKPDANSKFADDLTIVIKDGASQNTITMKLPNIGGYDSKIFVGDFSGDKVSDVFVKIPTGGSGGIIEHRIVTFIGEPQIIFGAQENKGIVITGRFVEGFKAELAEDVTKRKVTVDLANKRDRYVKANVYDTNGVVLREQNIQASSLGLLEPIDIDGDGVYEIKGQQRVPGIANADTVANIYSLLKYQDGKWIAKQIEVSLCCRDTVK
jgi:hypothetical protein